jgi:hypothetical protein
MWKTRPAFIGLFLGRTSAENNAQQRHVYHSVAPAENSQGGSKTWVSS